MPRLSQPCGLPVFGTAKMAVARNTIQIANRGSGWEDTGEHWMSIQENDISWQVLRRIVHDWAGSAAELTEVKPLEGGCINTTLALMTAGGPRAVLKISPHRVNREFLREAEQQRLR